jgi:hypothetical protein
MAGFCEHDNEPSGSINFWKFLDQFSYYQLLKESVHAVSLREEL